MIRAIPTNKSTAKIIPRDVATAFPPLNLRKIENICPNKTINETV